MNAGVLLKHFVRISEAPDAVSKVKQLIFDLAVRGKLVSQSLADEPAVTILERVKAIKEHATRRGEIKKDKDHWDGLPSTPPYKVPPGWIWVRLQDLFEISRGGSPRPAGDPKYFGGPIPWITVREITKDSSKFLVSTEGGLTEEGASKSRFVNPGDLLLTNSGATLGVPKITGIRACLNDGVAVLRSFHEEPLNDFAYVYLHSQTHAFRRVNQGMGQPNLNTAIIAGWFFPLPPLAEQVRIVARLDELMALCDRLEEAQRQADCSRMALSLAAHRRLRMERDTTRTDAQFFLDHFPRFTATQDQVEQLKQTIINIAIRGRLVHQHNDSTPELPPSETMHQRRARKSNVMRPIDNPPFQIPANWKWVRFGEVITDADAGWSPRCEAFPRTGDNWGVLKVSAVSWDRFLPEENKQLLPGVVPPAQAQVRAGDFLISRANTAELIAKSVVVEDQPKNLILSDKIVRLQITEGCSKRYLSLVNNHSDYARAYYTEEASGTSLSMKNVSRAVIYDLPIPLPPEEEQRRIVARVDELLTTCNRLRDQLSSSQDLRREMLKAVLEESLAGVPERASNASLDSRLEAVAL